MSATKYMSGHSDVFGGFISTPNCHRKTVEDGLIALGAPLSPDSAYLIQRGLRTMPVRLKQQAATAMLVAQTLRSTRGVSEVFSPALSSSPDHDRWKAYFSGGDGLLTFGLDGVSRPTIVRLVKSLQRFHLGVSWGGLESLIWPKQLIDVGPRERWLMRVSVGLESAEDLAFDLREALATALGEVGAVSPQD